jgi:hypothetical protein
VLWRAWNVLTPPLKALFKPPPLTPTAAPTNFCAATARRLAEIAQRNEIRQAAGLPLLPIVRELRRIKQWEDEQAAAQQFERYAAIHGQAVWNQLLKHRRETESDPNWWPRNLAEGVGYQRQVHAILREELAMKNTKIPAT